MDHDRTAVYRAIRSQANGRPSVVAIEVLRLWPRGVAPAPVTEEEAALWPVFAMVVTEPAEHEAAAARPLFDLLDRPRRDGEPAVVAAETTWSALDPARALLGLIVRGVAPVGFDVRILLPSTQVLGVLDVVAGGATIGVTTRLRADRLRERADIRAALRDVVLLRCPPSVELAALAHTLMASRDGERSR